VTLAALARALGVDAGVAFAGKRLVALVHTDGAWQLTAQPNNRSQHLDPVIPEELPPAIQVLQPPDSSAEIPAAPQCGWIKQFTAG
jgi:hypothetical protein